MTYGKGAAYGREWSQGHHCCCIKGPSITTWICPSTGSHQQEGSGKPYKLCAAQTDPFYPQQEQCSDRKGRCPAELWCIDLMLLLPLLPSGLLWCLSCDRSCARWSAWVNESAGNICISPKWMLPGKQHLQLAWACYYFALRSAVNPPLTPNWSIKCFQILPIWAM